jgi:hypothetical protein
MNEIYTVTATRDKSPLLVRVIVVIMIIAIALMFPAAPLYGQSAQSARSLGMAGSYMTLSNGCEAGILNPANLGLPGRAQYSIKLFSVSGQVNNNAFSLADYNRYNGAYLTESDKQYILSKIPGSGLNLDFAGTASALSFSVGAFAFTTQAIGGGYGSLAKDPIELALLGNKIGQSFSVDGSNSVNWSAIAFGLSYGREIYSVAGYEVAAGASIKYLRGLIYYDVSEITAHALTLVTGFEGEGGLTTLESEGGNGYAFDVGLAARKDNLTCGLVIRNLLASINWNDQIENKAYTFQCANLTLENSDDDTIWTSDDYDLSIASFRSRPPIEVELGASQQFEKLLVSASLRQGFKSSAFVSGKPRVAAGGEYQLLSFMTPRAGFSVGGSDELSTAVGLGFIHKPVYFDVAYASAGRLLPWGGTGGQVAVATIFEF